MSTHQVLIVEDNLADAELTSDLLVAAEVAQFNVLRAATAGSAVETLKSRRVDAVLLDLNLPDSRGLETLRQVKPTAADAPIIVLSGVVTPELLVQARDEGAEEVFDKDESNTPLLSLSVLYIIERTRSRVQQKQLEALLDATADAIVVVGANGQVQYVNQAALTLFGRAREHFEKSLPEFAVSDGRTSEVTIKTPEEDRICEMRIVPIQWQRQSARLASLRDITRQKKLEMQLMVADRMASIGTLAAGVAHEINNPLASVIGNLQLACDTLEQRGADRLPERDAEQVLEELYDAREGAERVRQIVRDLRVFARSEDERREPVDVQKVVESALRMAWNELRHRAMVVRKYARVPPVLANEARLGQVILNLLVNAAQSIPEGDSARNEIRVSTELDEQGRVAIAITDTGSGMPPEVQRRLFTPFYSTKPPGSGTGLGLAICHRIISALNGEISFESHVNKGTRFVVALPAAEGDVSPHSQNRASPAPSIPVRRARILVIDDDQAVGSLVRRALLNQHDVKVVSGAELALQMLRRGEEFDIILCDVMMPQMTGAEFYEAVQRSNSGTEARIIFMTGGAFTPTAREFLDRMGAPFLEKPFNLSVLRDLVSSKLQ